jgi:hypothetical protein
VSFIPRVTFSAITLSNHSPFNFAPERRERDEPQHGYAGPCPLQADRPQCRETLQDVGGAAGDSAPNAVSAPTNPCGHGCAGPRLSFILSCDKPHDGCPGFGAADLPPFGNVEPTSDSAACVRLDGTQALGWLS